MGFSLGKGLFGSMPTWLGKGLGGSIGNELNDLTGVNSQMDKSYKQQVQAMNLQNAYNTKMWNIQNEYNSPASQLARMREAGIDINPTSYALGTGNLSNVASNVSSESGFAGNGSPAGNPINALIGMAQGIQGMNESQARIDNMRKQNENLDGVIRSTKLENDIRQHNLNLGRETNTPVGSMPTFEASVVREGNNLLNVLKQAHAKARAKYVKEHPDYKGW